MIGRLKNTQRFPVLKVFAIFFWRPVVGISTNMGIRLPGHVSTCITRRKESWLQECNFCGWILYSTWIAGFQELEFSNDEFSSVLIFASKVSESNGFAIKKSAPAS